MSSPLLLFLRDSDPKSVSKVVTIADKGRLPSTTRLIKPCPRYPTMRGELLAVIQFSKVPRYVRCPDGAETQAKNGVRTSGLGFTKSKLLPSRRTSHSGQASPPGLVAELNCACSSVIEAYSAS